MKVAFQGKPGAYSESALYEYFGPKTQALGFELSEQVCESVRDKESDMGILPVENSIVGDVDVNLDLFASNDVYIIGEHFFKINHCLLAKKGTKRDQIEEVYSHPIALAQCRDFLNRHQITAIADFDTAGACLKLSQRKDKNHGAIASMLCAKYYDLDIVEEHIQKVQNNITRFLIFVRSDDIPEKIKEEKTSMAFQAGHQPGALLSCIKTFADHGLNLTKLESRPIPENPFVYTFFVDIAAPYNGKEMQGCLKELATHAKHIRVMGSYPAGKMKLG